MCRLPWLLYRWHFNPLPPHGGRPLQNGDLVMRDEFQSTPSAWRETEDLHSDTRQDDISIHSLRMEGDLCIHTGT